MGFVLVIRSAWDPSSDASADDLIDFLSKEPTQSLWRAHTDEEILHALAAVRCGSGAPQDRVRYLLWLDEDLDG